MKSTKRDLEKFGETRVRLGGEMTYGVRVIL